jgi:DNA primase
MVLSWPKEQGRVGPMFRRLRLGYLAPHVTEPQSPLHQPERCALMSPIDWEAVRARHHLGPVARRTGLDVPDTGRAMVSCPLPDHDDRRPSMHLDLDRDRYFCFGCGSHGDVVQWVCDIEGVRPVQAIVILDGSAPIAGVLSSRATARRYTQRDRIDLPDLERTAPERVRAAIRAAWRFYTSPSFHERAVKYLVQERRIDVGPLEIEARRPVVGHTADHPNGATWWLQSQGFTLDECIDAGLTILHPDGSTVDFFRNRLILPVADSSGLVGFVGRTTAGREPKYLNQTLTHTYDKKVALYQPAPHSLDADASVVVVEGTLDALAIAAVAAQAGLSAKYAAVSASGLRLSDRQLDAILDLHPRAPVLAADGDQAGRNANLEWAARLVARYRETVITAWPEGEDPASWLAAHGPDGLTAVTRRGCLDAPAEQVRPRHCGAVLTQSRLDQLPETIAERDAALRQLATDIGYMSRGLGPNASDRLAAEAAILLVPVAVDVAIAAGAQLGKVLERAAAYAAPLPPAGRAAFATRACEVIGAALPVPPGGIEGRLWTLVERRAGASQRSANGNRGRPLTSHVPEPLTHRFGPEM